jgi:hypothetical protein
MKIRGLKTDSKENSQKEKCSVCETKNAVHIILKMRQSLHQEREGTGWEP